MLVSVPNRKKIIFHTTLAGPICLFARLHSVWPFLETTKRLNIKKAF